MIERLLAWMQRNFVFITEDMYPDFDRRMDRARLASQTAILRLHRDAEMVEREIIRSREIGKGNDFADDLLTGKE
jgi:hypothetical protein